MLLDKGVDVNIQDEYYDNALYAASIKDYNQVMQMLLDKRVNVNIQGEYYGNAL